MKIHPTQSVNKKTTAFGTRASTYGQMPKPPSTIVNILNKAKLNKKVIFTWWSTMPQKKGVCFHGPQLMYFSVRFPIKVATRKDRYNGPQTI
ncbi:hypothetical protein Hanom_Chr09g00780801 [Helianthus anomalus]